MVAPHLIVDISAHGFGHLAQTATVLNALRRDVPDLKVTVRSNIDSGVLTDFVEGPFDTAEGPPDFGVQMVNPYEVDVARTATAYVKLHEELQRHIDDDAERLKALNGNLHFSNVGYLSIAAAKKTGLPSVALCCLNWADILEPYLSNESKGGQIQNQIRQCYQQADVFLQARPTMPMDWLENKRSIGPLARIGHNHPEVLFRRSDAKYFVVASLGGIVPGSALSALPVIEDVCWITAGDWSAGREDVITVAEAGLPFIDLIASCDALLTKPGYGAFVEAACNSTRVLYVDRGSWPESPYLERWLEVHGVCQSLARGQFEAGGWEADLLELLDRPRRPKVMPSGVAEAVAVIRGFLSE